MTDESDTLGIAHCLTQLGIIAWERFREAQIKKKPVTEQISYLDSALQFCNQALGKVPREAVKDRAVINHQLGIIYLHKGDLPNALQHYYESIRCSEIVGDIYLAAFAQTNIAVALYGAGRVDDALEYARASLRNFGAYGEGAAKEIQKTMKLIAEIEQDIKNKR